MKNLKELLSEYEYVVIAAGPSAAPELCEEMKNILGEESLYFYDAQHLRLW